MRSCSVCVIKDFCSIVWVAAISRVALRVLALVSTTGWLWAGIPEPDVVWYGKVLGQSGGSTVRVTVGTLVWRLEPVAGGEAIILTTALTNINDQFSYALRLPCESPEPGVTATPRTVVLSNPATRYRRGSVTLDGQPLTLSGATDQFGPLLTDRGRAELIDLTVATSSLDVDGDGMADDWERQFFGGLSANPNDDFDRDGVSNLREFRAGTNPKDAESLFEIVEIRSTAGGISLGWSSQTGKRYRVRRASQLLGAASSYQTVATGLTSTPPFNEFIDPQAAGGTQFFYLIEIEE